MNKRKQGRPDGKSPRGPKWEPMQPATPVPMTEENLANLRAKFGPDQAAAERLIEEMRKNEVWKNHLYTCTVTRWTEGDFAGEVQELSIKRNDRKAAHDWRDFQRIKTEIAGPEIEAVELYPAESRLMDTANQYYLFCLPPGQRLPLGYDGARNVATAEEATNLGATQRELPEDWEPADPLRQLLDKADEVIAIPPTCQATRYASDRECSETPPKFQVVYSSSGPTAQASHVHPACFLHGIAEVDRHHASGGMARVELQPLSN